MYGMQGEGQAIGGPSMESMAGRLLVATPALKDPNFDRTVVLLVAHEPGGALGVVLNRATEVAVAEVLADWGGLARDPAVVFEGGPVQPEAGHLPRPHPRPRRRTRAASTGSPAPSARSTSPATRSAAGVVGVRVFAGYAGWAPGQLEEEIKRLLVLSTRCPGTPSSTAPTICGRWCCAARVG